MESVGGRHVALLATTQPEILLGDLLTAGNHHCLVDAALSWAGGSGQGTLRAQDHAELSGTTHRERGVQVLSAPSQHMQNDSSGSIVPSPCVPACLRRLPCLLWAGPLTYSGGAQDLYFLPFHPPVRLTWP